MLAQPTRRSACSARLSSGGKIDIRSACKSSPGAASARNRPAALRRDASTPRRVEVARVPAPVPGVASTVVGDTFTSGVLSAAVAFDGVCVPQEISGALSSGAGGEPPAPPPAGVSVATGRKHVAEIFCTLAVVYSE